MLDSTLIESKILFNYIAKSLSPLYGEPEAREIAFIFVEYLTGFCRTDVLLNKEVEDFNPEKFYEGLRKLLAEEPIQYITGFTFFKNEKIFVNPSVLIPRPETEELVDLIIKENPAGKHATVLDIGTGSGCIAISIKKAMPDAKIFGLDISEPAIKTASVNAKENHVAIQFIKADILGSEGIALLKSIAFDIIVSNPPYVMESEKAEMKPNVIAYEPTQALFVPDENPLVFYETILQFATQQLKPEGKVYFEINEKLGAEMESLMQKHGFKGIQIKKDFNNKVRFAIGSFNIKH